jgi:hypothetical protein
VDERELQDALESLENGHLALACGRIGADLDLGGLLFDGGCGFFSVRLGGGLAGPLFREIRASRAYHGVFVDTMSGVPRRV